MALAPIHVLARIIATRSTLFRRLDRLAVDDARRGFRVSALPNPLLPAQFLAYPLPRAAVPPVAEVVLNRRPGRQIMGQQPPRATRAQQVQDGIHNLPQIMLAWMARPPLRQQGLNDRLIRFCPTTSLLSRCITG